MVNTFKARIKIMNNKLKILKLSFYQQVEFFKTYIDS